MLFSRKKFISFALVTLFLFSIFVAIPVLAQSGFSNDVNAQLGAAAGENGAGFGAPQDPRDIIARTIRILLGLTGTVFLVLTIYAGYLWMTAGGNEDEVTKAKTLLTQAVMGLGIILLAYSITIFVFNTAMGKGVLTGSYWSVQQPLAPNCGAGKCP